MSNKHLPTIEYLRQRLDYDPATGCLIWRKCASMPENWNARYVGTEAFTATTTYGYKVGGINKISYFAHRIAFAVFHGRWPNNILDHINGDKADNRIANLREATCSQNQHNRRKGKNNTSGFKGVYKVGNGWVARITLKKDRYYLGYFQTLELAANAYADAAQRMHGEFARVDG